MRQHTHPLEEKNIFSDYHFSSASKILIGISGGPDSTCLLHLLHRQGIPLIAAHVNYNLRGIDSLKDEKFVRETCKSLGVPLYIKSVHPAKSPKTALQEWARDLRFTFFVQVLKQTSCTTLALAHTADDQAETVMFRLLRNSSVKELSAMKSREYLPSYNMKIIRPLIGVRKSEILEFLHGEKISYRIDKSNAKSTYTRNKIRNILFPLLRKDFGADPVSVFVKLGKQFSEISDFLAQETSTAYKKILRKQTAREISLVRASFNKLHPLLKNQVIRFALSALAPEERISRRVLDEFWLMVKKSRSGAQIQLSHLLLSIIDYDTIRLKKLSASHRAGGPGPKKQLLKTVAITSLARIAISVKLHLGLLEIKKGAPDSSRKDRNTAVIDLSKTGNKLVIRSRKPGDRIYLVGSTGSKKVHDILIDAKFPRDQRDLIPMITTEKGELIWIAGVRADRRFSVKKGAKYIATLTYLRYNE